MAENGIEFGPKGMLLKWERVLWAAGITAAFLLHSWFNMTMAEAADEKVKASFVESQKSQAADHAKMEHDIEQLRNSIRPCKK